ncbi:MAG: glycoside hydrolase family 57 protein [Paludibacter sp.]|nr:glycoside hydrolase family 57 protein [Paludibacter sp.]MDD4198320.1 glycoside hydrolase family 57 protein [Paludibacter sp.]MDD4428061.1 glycoside hydrolase family 57 protein [Paludibacter sp.]
MKNICFYFQIHQPLRLKKYRFFQIGQDHYYYDDFHTEEKIRVLAEQSYLPANRIIADMIRSSNGKFKCAFSISGVALEQLEQYAPDVIDSFRELMKTGSIEFLTEPYGHSLASVFDADEFEMQVNMHADKIENLFGKRPTTLRNTELIYSDEIGETIAKMGFKTVLIEEAKHVMGWKSPNFVYSHAYLNKLKLLVRNNKLSEDIFMRFSSPSWEDYPLTAEKFIGWIASAPSEEKIFNIWMGYESLGVVQRPESGIFDFMKAIPYHAMEHQIGFALPGEIAKKNEATGSLLVTFPTSWWGHEKDLSPWNGNDLQYEALEKLYNISVRVRMCNDKPLLRDWLMLQTSDHFRYMSHKEAYGSHYESPYEAFVNYMNVLADFLDRVHAQYPSSIENEELNELLKTITHQEKEIATLEGEVKKLKARKIKTSDK